MGILARLEKMDTTEIEKLGADELRELVSKGSKLAYQQLRRLKKSDVADLSTLLIKNDYDYELKVFTPEKVKKMTTTQLKKTLTKIAGFTKLKTSSIAKTKKHIEKLKAKGIDIENLTKTDWKRIRMLIEEAEAEGSVYGSEEIIKWYKEESTTKGRKAERDKYREAKEKDLVDKNGHLKKAKTQQDEELGKVFNLNDLYDI